LIRPKDGAFSLAPKLTPWKPKEYHIFDVLYWIKYAFSKATIDLLISAEEACLNLDAIRLYRDSNSNASFSDLAAQTSTLSQAPSALFDRGRLRVNGDREDDILFSPLENAEIEKMQKRIGVRGWDN